MGFGGFVAGALGMRQHKVGPTAQETALARGAANDFNDFISRYVPASQKLRGLTKATPNAKARVTSGLSLAAARATQRKRGRRGNAAFASSDRTSARGSVIGQGKAAASEGLVQRERRGLQKLVSFGRGLSFDAQLGLSQAGADATKVAFARNDAKYASRAALVQGLAQVAGAAGAKHYLNSGGNKNGFAAMQFGQGLAP